MAARMGKLCPVAVITDGSRGSFIAVLGEVHSVAIHPSADGVVDVSACVRAHGSSRLHSTLGDAIAGCGVAASCAFLASGAPW